MGSSARGRRSTKESFPRILNQEPILEAIDLYVLHVLAYLDSISVWDRYARDLDHLSQRNLRDGSTYTHMSSKTSANTVSLMRIYRILRTHKVKPP